MSSHFQGIGKIITNNQENKGQTTPKNDGPNRILFIQLIPLLPRNSCRYLNSA